jgi:hypothetical protein
MVNLLAVGVVDVQEASLTVDSDRSEEFDVIRDTKGREVENSRLAGVTWREKSWGKRKVPKVC